MKYLGLIIVVALAAFNIEAGRKKVKPLMREFMGINAHYHFKPKLYGQTCKLVRMYHNMCWDVKAIGDQPTFPTCVNKINWKTQVYGKWQRDAGYESSLCAMFGPFGRGDKNYRGKWKGKTDWIGMYGKKMAQYFGPSGNKLVTSIEVGNEPGGGKDGFDEKLYRTLFEKMAKGIRAGDPKMKIVTCTAQARAADKYSVNLDKTFNSRQLIDLFDAISVHVYAAMPLPKRPWPKTRGQWDRSYPEDPGIEYLKVVNEVIDWRNSKAKGKEIWITEFGWDCVTPNVMKDRKGWMKKLNWQGVTDLQQAQYIVRSYLVFAEMDVDRAYMYFYDDKNSPHVHGAAGLTRNFKPKMSYWAQKQLYQTLGDYRFNKIIRKNVGKLYVYEFKHNANPKDLIWVAWQPTGPAPGVKPSGKRKSVTLSSLPSFPTKVTEMAVSGGPAKAAQWQKVGNKVTVQVGESPIYIKF